MNWSLESQSCDGEATSEKNQSAAGATYAMVLKQKEDGNAQPSAPTAQQPVVYDKLEHVNNHQ